VLSLISIRCIRIDVRIDEGCDCGSVKEYGEKMDEGGREGEAL